MKQRSTAAGYGRIDWMPLSRPARSAHPDALGLSLEDAKSILGQIQKAVLTDQIEEVSDVNRACPTCGADRVVHDRRARSFDTLFGRLRLVAPRFRRCGCAGEAEVIGGPVSPIARLFPDPATPELRRLQAERGARHSFREAARIIEAFLPCAKQMNTTIRNRLGEVARKIDEDELTELTSDETARSPRLTVFLDGAHIRCRPEYQKRHLNVVVGKIESRNRRHRFGLVPEAVLSPSNQLRRDLIAQGWDGQSPVTVISDGEPALPNPVRSAVQGAVRHFLDWRHVSMRVQHVENAVQGLVGTRNFPGTPVLFRRSAETLRWFLWRGKIQAAGTLLQWLHADCARLPKDDVAVREAAARVRARCSEIYTYLTTNMGVLTNYGWRYRNGFPISSSRAEGCVDDIGNSRMGKRRRMRWSPKDAHRVAVARAAVLDGRLTVSRQKLAA